MTGGTPYAMAPEQLRGARPDTRSDVWALGVLLQEIVVEHAAVHAPRRWRSSDRHPARAADANPVSRRARRSSDHRSVPGARPRADTSARAKWWLRSKPSPM